MREGRKLTHLADCLAVIIPAVLAPLLLFPKLEWMWIAGLVPVVAWLDRKNPLNLLFLGLVAMVGVSLWATFDIRFSLGKVAGTLLGLLILWGIGRFVTRQRRLRLAAAGLFGAGCALVGIALVGTAWSAKFAVIGRLVALFPAKLKGIPGAEEGFNPNAVGGTLALVLPVAVAVLVYTFKPRNRVKWRLRIPAALASAGFAAVLLISQSRGAWLGTAVGMAVLALAAWWRWARWVAAAGTLAGGAALYWLKPWEKFAATSDLTSGGDISLAGRVEIWSRAIYGIQDFPFTGMGMNAFRKVVHILYPLFTIPPDQDIASAHNHVLQAALDLGIPGMVAYLAIWTAVLAMLVKVWRRSGDQFHRALALGLFGGLIAYFVFQITDAIPLGAKVGVFWWFAIGIAVSLFRIENPDFRRQARWWEILLLWVLLSLVSISFVGDHPYVALGIAILGGVYLGWQVTAASPER
ncbi:MAG: O-antigen ligase family protein [Acidobacteriota bacterium]